MSQGAQTQPDLEALVTSSEWFDDFKIYSHYFSANGLGLAAGDRQGLIWSLVSPGLVLQHVGIPLFFSARFRRTNSRQKSLLNGMLALSALHLAYLNPHQQRHYLAHSARHQVKVLARLRQGLDAVTEENCTELFMLSHMVMIYEFCSFARSTPDRKSRASDLQELGNTIYLGQGKQARTPKV